MIIKHGFVKTLNFSIEDCIVVTDAISKWGKAYRHLKDDSSVYITFEDSNIDEKIEEAPVAPQKGCSLYILPDCPIAMDSIRRLYTIKRKPADADYIIFHDNMKTYRAAITPAVAWLPKSNVFVMLASYPKGLGAPTIMKRAQELYDSPLDWDDSVIIDGEFTTFKMTIAHEMLCRLYCGFLPSKPALLSQLDLNSSEKLTLDTLLLYYNTGRASTHNDGGVKNFLLQATTLDSYDWRNYKGTLALVNRVLGRYPEYCCYDETKGMKSQLSKTERLITTLVYSKPVSEDDFHLGQQFLMSILGMKDLMFASLGDVLIKLSSAGVQYSDFLDYFATVVKITPNEYKNAETDSSSVR